MCRICLDIAVFKNASDFFDSSVPALLALRRFFRGAFRQVSLSVITLIVILNLAGNSPARDHNPSEIASGSRHTATSVAPVSAPAIAPSTNVLRPQRLLRPEMTSYRLTSARLSVPPVEKAVANIATAQ